MITAKKCKDNKDKLILTVGIQHWHISLIEARHLYKKLGLLIPNKEEIHD